MSVVHIYAPPSTKARRMIHCKTCQCKRRCVECFYIWHEPNYHCTGCGNDPYIRGNRFSKITFYRSGLIATAKRYWNEATTRTEAIKAASALSY